MVPGALMLLIGVVLSGWGVWFGAASVTDSSENQLQPAKDRSGSGIRQDEDGRGDQGRPCGVIGANTGGEERLARSRFGAIRPSGR